MRIKKETEPKLNKQTKPPSCEDTGSETLQAVPDTGSEPRSPKNRVLERGLRETSRLRKLSHLPESKALSKNFD